MRDLFDALPLPDDRPITSICIVEDISGCPANYNVVSKSHDQDIDADLCKDGFFKRVTRYLCHSKTEGFFGYVVEHIVIVNDKESRPMGYTVLESTQDTSQRSFRKKQICIKAVPRHMASQIITDIIVLSKAKIAPEGFTLVGEMNGLSICYKQGQGAGTQAGKQSTALPYGMNPNARASVGSGTGGIYPGISGQAHDDFVIVSNVPTRPAPGPPMISAHGVPGSNAFQSNDVIYGAHQSLLFGVPFVFNQKYVDTPKSGSVESPIASCKSAQQVNDEFYYSFTLETDVSQRHST